MSKLKESMIMQEESLDSGYQQNWFVAGTWHATLKDAQEYANRHLHQTGEYRVVYSRNELEAYSASEVDEEW